MIKKEDYWCNIKKSYEESGLPPGRFCQDKSISGSRLRYYRNKFQKSTNDIHSSYSLKTNKRYKFPPLIIVTLEGRL